MLVVFRHMTRVILPLANQVEDLALQSLANSIKIMMALLIAIRVS